MKRLPLYFYAIVLILGAVVTRECLSGLLRSAELAWTAWLQSAALPNPEPRVTLVTAENADGLLTPLDVALFLRAAMQFEAGVAGIASFEIDRGEEELLRSVLTRPTETRFVTGALLSPDEQADPVHFLSLKWPDAESLPNFPGVWNNLPVAAAAVSGFLNLPENAAEGSLPILARSRGEIVASFSFACLLRYLEANGVTFRSGQPGGELAFSNHCRIPVSAQAAVALQPAIYPEITRISLGDLLVAAEKGELAPTAVTEAMRDRIVVLAPAPTSDELRAGTFTLGQFQALGVASLAAQLQPPAFGLWVWLVPFLWFFPWLKLTDKWSENLLPTALLLTAAYALVAFTLASGIGLLLPGIPALVWALGLPAAWFFKRKSKSA